MQYFAQPVFPRQTQRGEQQIGKIGQVAVNGQPHYGCHTENEQPATQAGFRPPGTGERNFGYVRIPDEQSSLDTQLANRVGQG